MLTNMGLAHLVSLYSRESIISAFAADLVFHAATMLVCQLQKTGRRNGELFTPANLLAISF